MGRRRPLTVRSRATLRLLVATGRHNRVAVFGRFCANSKKAIYETAQSIARCLCSTPIIQGPLYKRSHRLNIRYTYWKSKIKKRSPLNTWSNLYGAILGRFTKSLSLGFPAFLVELLGVNCLSGVGDFALSTYPRFVLLPVPVLACESNISACSPVRFLPLLADWRGFFDHSDWLGGILGCL